MAYTPPGDTRRRVLEFVRERLMAGAPPTIREVQEQFGFRSVESARAQLDALVSEGQLVKTPNKSRSYRLPDDPRLVFGAPRLVPLLGRVQAGGPVTAVQEPEGYVLVEPRAAADDELFALRVRGESMTGAGILPDDIVIVRRQPSADPGDIVVALVSGAEDEATIKTLRRRRNRWYLQPENPEFAPIVPDPKALQILGKVIEVRRTLS